MYNDHDGWKRLSTRIYSKIKIKMQQFKRLSYRLEIKKAWEMFEIAWR